MTPPQLTYRPAEPDDAGGIHALTQAAYAEYTGTEAPSSVLSEQPEEIREALRAGAFRALVVEEAGRPVGSVRYRVLGGDCLYFFRLGLLPTVRGRGIAAQVLCRLEEEARRCGLRRLRCQVRLSVPRNYRLYLAAGFCQIAEETVRRGAIHVVLGTMEKDLMSTVTETIGSDKLVPVATDDDSGAAAAQQWDAAHVMKTYARQPVQFVRGAGIHLYDASGREYIDLLAGIAVCSVGHCHPYLVRALQEQAASLLHVSNLYLTEPQARLARRLVELSEFERVFFCNSGAEANEAAIKIARKWGRTTGGEEKTNFVTAANSFHGRTLATVTATGQPKYSKAFAPLPAGFAYVPFNDVDALQAAVTADTAAILLEPIQGEGGVRPASVEYLRAARELADRYGALLIFDEVQTGVGRTGALWAYQRYGVVPDIMTLAKGLGGGVPIGACLARGAAAEVFQPGDHGSTFAGNPLAATAANAVLDIVADERLTENARRIGAYLVSRLTAIREAFPEVIGGVRGMGLMLGVEVKNGQARRIVSEALAAGLVVNATGDDTLRLLPPLTLTEADADEAMRRLEQAVRAVAA